jgi:EmrB/QacA subfamily drug resistance transporter
LLKTVPHRYRVFLVCVIGIFITVFDTSSAIVALPTIALEFDTGLPTVQWVIIANSLTIAALLVPMGRLSDMIGRKRIYVVGCSIFAIASLLAALADSIVVLIAARAVVGIGSAMTQGTAMALIVSNFQRGERAKMLGLQMGGVGLGAMTGPGLGGLIVGAIGWQSLFIVTAITMLITTAAAQTVLRRRKERPQVARPPFDVAGAVLFSSLLTAGLLTLTLGPRAGWTAPSTVAGFVLFAVLTAAFIRVERRQPAPMLDFALFRNSAFAVGALSGVVAFMCISSMRFLAPFFFQGVKGFDASGVGLLMLPAAATTAIAGPFAGKFADRFGVRLVANIGFSIAIVGLISFTVLSADTPTTAVVIGLVIMGLGMSSFGAPNSASILNSVGSESHGVASGFINLCRNTGNTLGIAFGTAVVTLTMGRAGFAPSIAEVKAAADPELLRAFARGIQVVASSLVIAVVPILAAVIAWSIRARIRPEQPPD